MGYFEIKTRLVRIGKIRLDKLNLIPCRLQSTRNIAFMDLLCRPCTLWMLLWKHEHIFISYHPSIYIHRSLYNFNRKEDQHPRVTWSVSLSADVLGTKGSRASAIVALAYVTRKIPATVPKGLTHKQFQAHRSALSTVGTDALVL